MSRRAVIFVIGVVVILTACQGKKETAGDGQRPKKLIFGVVSGADPGLRESVLKPIAAYVGQKVGIPVELVFTSDYTALIEAIRAKKVEIADLPPFAYVIATKSIAITPLVVLGADGKPNFYRSMMIASKQSGLTTMDDVRARAKEINLCFTEPASASGHLVPNAYLTSIGLEPKTSFKGVLFGGGHLATVFSVKAGKVDIGCTIQIVLDMMVRKNSIQENEFTILWQSDPIVAQPIVVRNDLDKGLAKKIQDAYINMHTEAPQLLENYLKIYLKDAGRLSYMPAADSMYNGLRKLAAGITELN